MGIQLLKDKRKGGKFIKMFPQSAPIKTEAVVEAEPTLFWDKYSICPFSPSPLLETYNKEFLAQERYSLTHINAVVGGNAAPGIGHGLVYPEDDQIIGEITKPALTFTRTASDVSSTSWLVNAKIGGLVHTEHKIKWSAIYEIADPAKTPILEVLYDDWAMVPTGDSAQLYYEMRILYPDGIDLFVEKQIPTSLIADLGGGTRTYIFQLTHLALHTFYDRIFISFPAILGRGHSDGEPTFFSGTLKLIANVDGKDTDPITFNVTRAFLEIEV